MVCPTLDARHIPPSKVLHGQRPPAPHGNKDFVFPLLSDSPYMIHSSTIPHTTTNDKADFSESLFPIAPQTGQIISSPTPTSFNVRLHMDFNSQQQQQASNPLLFKNLPVLCWSYFQIPTAKNSSINAVYVRYVLHLS